ncbi:MAG: hypothetical protein M3069_20950 [Chloroflexota bacterium]|nr:hypothetical protein [Chloroflexota bacterium]
MSQLCRLLLARVNRRSTTLSTQRLQCSFILAACTTPAALLFACTARLSVRTRFLLHANELNRLRRPRNTVCRAVPCPAADAVGTPEDLITGVGRPGMLLAWALSQLGHLVA